jgi:hypothetical protein
MKFLAKTGFWRTVQFGTEKILIFLKLFDNERDPDRSNIKECIEDNSQPWTLCPRVF